MAMNYCDDGIPIRLHVGDRTYSFDAAAELIGKQTAELERLKQPLGDEHFRRMDFARHLLPEPGAEVVGECLQEIRRLTALLEEQVQEDEKRIAEWTDAYAERNLQWSRQFEENKALRRELSEARKALRRIAQVASGEEQLEDMMGEGDTAALQWIDGFSSEALEHVAALASGTGQTDTERIDALESGIHIACENGHVVHEHGCTVVLRNGTLMQLVSEDRYEVKWRRITWRAAIDAAMDAAEKE